MDTQHNRAKIEDLIASTSDPVARATLLVLSNIDHALNLNTAATQAIADAFKSHRGEFLDHRVEFGAHVLYEAKLFSGIRWAWWAATGMGVVIAGLGGFIVFGQMNMLVQTIATVHAIELRQSSELTRITELERRQAIIDEERSRK
jgi:hypothetical protein